VTPVRAHWAAAAYRETGRASVNRHRDAGRKGACKRRDDQRGAAELDGHVMKTGQRGTRAAEHAPPAPDHSADTVALNRPTRQGGKR
jgi:hypothetical protein